MGDWTDEPEEMSVQPPPPRLRLSLGKEARPLRDTTNLRFAEPVSTAELKRSQRAVPHLLPMRFRLTC
ncbi:hypothetical protein GBAR_LOCUS10156 [Geodia barretti]|uniref:Uncharacterized protein n=1 Tax=Geodia barretti TaxID=519541 RepID=A0AA35RUH1_GEOBA|nr:hypothetical protein GBAR_LOCUS10156 [Geodia barretti]